MSNIYGKYSLTEIASTLRLSLAWVKKLEKYLGLKWGSGVKGKKSYYTEAHRAFFQRISALRTLGYDLEGIKEIYDSERKIIKASEKFVLNLTPREEISLIEGKKRNDVYGLTLFLNIPPNERGGYCKIIPINKTKFLSSLKQKNPDTILLKDEIDLYTKNIKIIFDVLVETEELIKIHKFVLGTIIKANRDI